MKTKTAALHYQLTDVLEMNFSVNPKVIERIKDLLFNGPIKDFNLHPLSSFALDDKLVVIQSGELDFIKRFYLLDSQTESFKTYCLHLLRKERKSRYGNAADRSLESKRLTPA